MTDRHAAPALTADELNREMTEQWIRLTRELDDIEARIIELEMKMASHGIDCLGNPMQTLH